MLELLAGRDPGVTEALLYFESQFRMNPDTLGLLLTESDSFPHIQEHMFSTARRLAALWIDSGKDSSNPGIDSPALRNVEYRSDDESFSIHDLLVRRLFDQHPQFMQMTSSGKLGFSDSFPRLTPNPTNHFFDRNSLARYGEKLALYFFAKLLNSSYSLNLARCDDCGAYFAYKRARQVAVKNGVHCDRCKVSDSVKRTKDRRNALNQELIIAAAKARVRWKKSHRNPNQDQWVLEQVNAEFARVLRAPKSRRWITTHKDAILKAEIEERKQYAKG